MSTELDFDKLKKRIEDIDQAILEIERLTNVSDEEFFADKRNILSVKYLLLQAIEATGAICLHISARKLKKSSEGFVDCFRKLEDNELLNEDLCGRMQKMSEFRNLLVHEYHKMDDEKILKYARENLNDFKEFTDAVSKMMSSG